MASLRKRRWVHKGVAKEAWEVRWFDTEGKRRGKVFGSKIEASIFHERVGGVGRGAVFEPDTDDATVGFAAKAYLKWMQSKVIDGRCSTDYLCGKDRTIEFYILKRLGLLKISALTLHTLTEWHAGVKRARNIQAGTARQIALELKRIVAFAQRRQWVSFNPVDALLEELRGIPKRRVRSFKPDEMRSLLAAVAAKANDAQSEHQKRWNDMLQCYVHIGAFCGLRVGEIGALDLDHVDLEAGLMHVEYNLLHSGTRKSPKSEAGNRTVPIPEHLVAMLKRWIVDHSLPAKELQRYIRPDHRRFLFLTVRGRPIAMAGGLYSRWREALGAAGLLTDKDPHHFHATRHFFASWLLANGGSPADTAALMGHSNPAMTLSVYAHAVAPVDHAAPIQTAMAGALIAAPVPMIPDMRDAA